MSFWAIGARGGEEVTIKVGGIGHPTRPYHDSFAVVLESLALTTTWTRYEIDLEGQDLSAVAGGFSVSAAELLDDDVVLYLDDIRYE